MNRPDLTGLAPEALELLLEYDWPGNVRQLQSVIRQALLNSTGTVVTASNLPDFIHPLTDPADDHHSATLQVARSSLPSAGTGRASSNLQLRSDANSDTQPESLAETPHHDDFSLRQFIDERLQSGSHDLYAEVVEQMERRLFAKVLQFTGGNQSKAAEILGITRGKVRDRINSFNIQIDPTVSMGSDES